MISEQLEPLCKLATDWFGFVRSSFFEFGLSSFCHGKCGILLDLLPSAMLNHGFTKTCFAEMNLLVDETYFRDSKIHLIKFL